MRRIKKELLKKIHGGQVCQIVSTAARLHIAEAIGEGASLSELSSSLTLSPPLLQRILRALVALRLLEEQEGTFTLTEEGELLLPEHPDSLHAIAAYKGAPFVWNALGQLENGLRSGRSPFEVAHGTPLFDYLEEAPEDATLFHTAMQRYVEKSSTEILDQYPFQELTRVCDVGGGRGSFLTTLKERYPHLLGTVYDLPHVARTGLVDPTLTFIGGNFFEAVPTGFDGYLLRNILHDWSDEECIKILVKIRATLPPHGRLLLFETVIREEQESRLGTFADVTMFVLTPGGRERRLDELESLLHQADLQIHQVIHTTGSKSLIEAIIPSS